MKKLIIYTLLLFLFIGVKAENPKREMRANWLTTVWRLDWPSTTVPANGTEAERQGAINTQKNGLIAIFDKMKDANMNAVFFQIRSMSDVMYPSAYENWSSFISSERGAHPGYDPLAFAIEEAHKRGLELHAWINPYRYSTSEATHGNLPTDYVNTHPDWLMTYDSYTKILNPGNPEVLQRIVDIVEEVVSNYDVDGIVFDDYFYVNRVTNDTMDQNEYNLYNPKNLSRADWRRENCNIMIESVYNKIQEIKPYVTFGVSPAGVAASSVAVAQQYDVPPAPVGSDWQYNGIYSDPLAWISRGSLDYISPQIYWTTGSANAYDKLAPWWSMVSNKYATHFYSSHSLSAMTGSQPAPQSEVVVLDGEMIDVNLLSGIEQSSVMQNREASFAPPYQAPDAIDFYFQELGLQVDWNRNSDLNDAPGSVFYATAKATGASFINYLKSNVFTQQALTPAIAWKKSEEQSLVSNLAINNSKLTWSDNNSNVRYSIYAIPNGKTNENDKFTSSKYLIGVSYKKEFQLPTGVSSSSHQLAVAVLDRYGNEFSPRIINEDLQTPSAVNLISPANNNTITIPTNFEWSVVEGAISYIWEVATDVDFTNIVAARETTETQFSSGLTPFLKENIDYYWRVKTRKANAEIAYSEVFSFKGNHFSILTPENGATEQPLTPTITWMDLSPTANYVLEIATSALFTSNSVVYRKSTKQTSHQVEANRLLSETIYYARVEVNDRGMSAMSNVISFKTQSVVIPIPIIISPQNDETLSSNQVLVKWEEQASKGFRVELSSDSSFPSRSIKVKQTDAFTFEVLYDDIDYGTYYVRVKANNNDGLTDPSNVVKFSVQESTQVDSNELAEELTVKELNNGEVVLELNSNIQESAIVSIYSISGAMIYKKEIEKNIGKNIYSLKSNQLKKGVFLVHLSSPSGVKTLKLAISN